MTLVMTKQGSRTQLTDGAGWSVTIERGEVERYTDPRGLIGLELGDDGRVGWYRALSSGLLPLGLVEAGELAEPLYALLARAETLGELAVAS